MTFLMKNKRSFFIFTVNETIWK